MYSIRRVTIAVEVESAKGRVKREGISVEFMTSEAGSFPVDNLAQIAAKFTSDKIQRIGNDFYKEEQNLLDPADRAQI